MTLRPMLDLPGLPACQRRAILIGFDFRNRCCVLAATNFEEMLVVVQNSSVGLRGIIRMKEVL
jgi:hypothetical protein